MINGRAQQSSELPICATLELVTAGPACDPGDEIGDLHLGLTAGISEPDLSKPVSRQLSGEGARNVGDAFWGQRRLLVVYDGQSVRT